MTTAQAQIKLKLVTSGLADVKAASKALRELSQAAAARISGGAGGGRGGGALAGTAARTKEEARSISRQISSAQMAQRTKERNEAFSIRAQISSARMAAQAKEREERASIRAAEQAQRARERLAAREMALNEKRKRSAVTVESEMARLRGLDERRAITAQARAGLGKKASFWTGHGFATAGRAALGAARDSATAMAGSIYTAQAMGAMVMGLMSPARELEISLAQMKSKGDLTDAQVAEMRKQMIGSTATGFGATAQAHAGIELAAAGVTGEKMKGALPTSLRFAQASGLGTEAAVTLLVDTMAQFSMHAEDFGRISDTLNKAANISTISVADLGESFKYIGPLANKAGLEFEQTAAWLAYLGENGRKGAQGGTDMRAILASLVKPARQAKDALAQLGITEKQLSKGAADPAAFFRMLSARMDKKRLDDAGRLRILKMMFGTEGMTGAAISMKGFNDASNGIDAFTAKVRDAKGSTDDLATAMSRTLDGQMRRTAATWEASKIKMAEGLAPAVNDVLPRLEGLARGIGDFARSNPQAFSALATSIGALVATSLTANLLSGLAPVFSAALAGLARVPAVAAAATALGTSAGGMIGGAVAAALAGYTTGRAIAEALGTDAFMEKVGMALADDGTPRQAGRGLNSAGASAADAEGDERERKRQEAFDWAAGGAAGEIVVKVQDDRTSVSTRTKKGPKLRLGANVSKQ